MRFIFGILVGCALTVVGAYVADTTDAASIARPMVNWDIVAKNIESLTTAARDGFKRITG
jgi:hypothetical protein